MLQQPESARKRISPTNSIWAAGQLFYCKNLKTTGRGSWIRTNDLQYPKLPRYQAALYPECPASRVDTRFPRRQQAY